MQKTKKTRKPFTFDYPAYYKKNEAKLKEYKAAWYQTNKERLREPMLKNQKRYTKRHPQKVAARKKAWDMNNKEHISTYRKKRYKSKLKRRKVTRKPFTMSSSELIDKLSIVSRKDVYGLPGARKELNLIMKWLEDAGIEGYVLLSIIRITQANADIWNKEHEMRNSVVGEMPENVVGRIAEQVREHNKGRVRYMNELNEAVGDTQVLEKIRHLSEEVYNKYYK